MNAPFSMVAILSVLATPGFAGSLKEGNRFDWSITNETTQITSFWQEIILQVDPDKIAIRAADPASSGFTVATFDRQLRATESGIWAYDPGSCGGIPSVLEVEQSDRFDVIATITDIKANTKNTLKMHCISKVVGKETRVIDGTSLDVFLIEDVADYNVLVNGAPATYEISGAYAPTVGWWVSKAIKETQRGIVTNKVTFTLQHYKGE
jgi:hypothetical protein